MLAAVNQPRIEVRAPEIPDILLRYVNIGSGAAAQTWMAENLNYKTPDGTSRCHPGNGNTNTSDADNANCTTYGRLYNWSTAMDIAASCNTTSCSGSVTAKHIGICPSGWNIPSNAEWDRLVRNVDGNTGTSSPYDSEKAGKFLKATTVWMNSSGNGQDTYGFSALPGGYGLSGNFSYAGDSGYWWSASEYFSDLAYARLMGYNSDVVYNNSNRNKSYLLSVRCLQD